MSLSRINKNIYNLTPRLHGIGNLGKIPVILSDSKGGSLEAVVDPQSHPENKLRFWYRRGKGVHEQYEWLRDNLQSELAKLGTSHITLYIWLGTCDLTEKSDKFIKLRTDDSTTVDSVCRGLKDIFDFTRQFPTITLVYLDIPYYSIYLWNLFHEHSDPEPFRQQDIALENQVSEVNNYIQQLNTILHKTSPNFSLDLEKSRKHRHEAYAKYSLNYGLYLDGVHPHPDLAKLWLIRIALRFENDCF